MRRTSCGWIVAVLVLGLAAGPLGGCREEGAAEKAGKAFDDAVEDAQDGMDDAKEKLAE